MGSRRYPGNGHRLSAELNNNADAIKFGIKQLKILRSSTPNRKELEWEIRLYKFILKQTDPEKAASDYFRVRNKVCPPRSKRETVRILGWVVE